MEPFFAAPEAHICRNLRKACHSDGLSMVQPVMRLDPLDFARSCLRGLFSEPRNLESRFLYDAEGSALFEQITMQPEYYLTRTEAGILEAHAADIRELTGPAHILELGSGSSAKTDHLLRAWLDKAPSACYLPVDVSAAALAGACDSIKARHPSVRVIPIHCEYREAFPLLAQLSPALVSFLGSSIGNFTPPQMSRFVMELAASMRPGDFFLLGIDLVKDRSLLEAAYNDQAGVTARFTRNLFARMNRELASSIDLDAVEHTAWYRAEKEQIEICARFTRQQTFQLTPPGRVITIPQGEVVQTEVCRKFRLEQVVPELERCGFITEGVFTDERRWFALVLLRRRPFYSVPKARRRV